jgi:phosphoribosylformylglycinamidine synthase
MPTVANKTFLITIADRSVTGLVCRDPMVGPWQTPVADYAVTLHDFNNNTGQALSLGERTPVALISGPASARLALAEAITNLAAAPIEQLSQIKLCANWMAPAGHPGEDANLYDTVSALGMELCPVLGIGIPVGKDSLSMKTLWTELSETKSVTAPVSLIITAAAPVSDARRCLTPLMTFNSGETLLILVDLGNGQNRLGGSVLAQTFAELGDTCPDLDQPDQLIQFFQAIQALNNAGKLLAYHDRSDGGLFVTLCEMTFASRCGLKIALDGLGTDPLAVLFTEEPGAVLQIRRSDLDDVMRQLKGCGHVQVIGTPQSRDWIEISQDGHLLFEDARIALQRLWSETSWRIQTLRDNPETARQEYNRIMDADDPGLHDRVVFDPEEDIAAPFIGTGERPKVAILREQGINGHMEMAAAFHRAGFAPVDVTMSDLLSGSPILDNCKGMAACGGFSYGDVLGAGEGWAKTILFNKPLRDRFQTFFERSDTFTLGVCNGCQMLSQLAELIPGARNWPRFVRNTSEQFESRLVMVEIPDNPSLLMAGMTGSRMPVVVAHGEGRAEWQASEELASLEEQGRVALRYVDNRGLVTDRYPSNPNGSPRGVTGVTTHDGRVTILMPHPERLFRAIQHSWSMPHWNADGPWMRLFRNARRWVA